MFSTVKKPLKGLRFRRIVYSLKSDLYEVTKSRVFLMLVSRCLENKNISFFSCVKCNTRPTHCNYIPEIIGSIEIRLFDHTPSWTMMFLPRYSCPLQKYRAHALYTSQYIRSLLMVRAIPNEQLIMFIFFFLFQDATSNTRHVYSCS